MVTIETFLVLAAIVVLIGLIVWRRDIKSGRIMRPKALTRARSVRDLFADTRSPAMAGGPRTLAQAAAGPDDGAATRRTPDAPALD